MRTFFSNWAAFQRQPLISFWDASAGGALALLYVNSSSRMLSDFSEPLTQ